MKRMQPSQEQNIIDTDLEEQNSLEDITVLETAYTPKTFNYKMNHRRRGKAIIFNNYCCEGNSVMKKKINQDVYRLKSTLSKFLKFEVIIYTDLELETMLLTLNKLSEENNFEKDDCLAIFLLTHGTLQNLTAKDNVYSIEDLWGFFIPTRCKTLAGKPKLFFINSCLDESKDSCNTFSENVININEKEKTFKPTSYTLPLCSDFLTYYSFVQVQNETVEGLWFIKFLTKMFEKPNIKKMELKKILSIVTRKTIAKYNNVYQTPTIMSTLIRNLYFK